MTTENEKSPAPELASEAADSGAHPARESIVDARAAGGNETSSKVGGACVLAPKVVDHCWRMYQLGQVSADHTAKEVFTEVLESLAAWLRDAGELPAAAPRLLRDPVAMTRFNADGSVWALATGDERAAFEPSTDQWEELRLLARTYNQAGFPKYAREWLARAASASRTDAVIEALKQAGLFLTNYEPETICSVVQKLLERAASSVPPAQADAREGLTDERIIALAKQVTGWATHGQIPQEPFGHFYAGPHHQASVDNVLRIVRASLLAAHPGQPEPINMLLFCPKCGVQHVDAPTHAADDTSENAWHNPPHRSHLCHSCGTIWRPADVPTNGVAAIETRGNADTWDEKPWSAASARLEQLRKALFESRDAMRVMSNWVKKSDPAGHAWGVHMVVRANAALNGEPEPRAEVTDAVRAYPDELTDDLRHVLGFPNFRCAKFAHLMRAGGADIKTKAEDEQAHVLHWLVKLVIDHGERWADVATEEMTAMRDKVDAARAGEAS